MQEKLCQKPINRIPKQGKQEHLQRKRVRRHPQILRGEVEKKQENRSPRDPMEPAGDRREAAGKRRRLLKLRMIPVKNSLYRFNSNLSDF